MIEDHTDDTHTLIRPGAGPRPLVTILLAAAVAVAAVALVVLAVWLRQESADRSAQARDRAAAVQAAQRFSDTWNNFTAEEAKEYVERVSPLLTTKFRSEFTQAAQDVVTGIEQQRLSSEGKVLPDADGIPLVAIASIDVDSAEVLVVSDANRVSSGQQVLRHWRWEVHLKKVDGTWLVDGFDEV